jgi:glucose dehydrogenase
VPTRGAAWNGKIYVGTVDGRPGIDAASGERVWETLTIDPTERYSISGAPRVAKGRVLIGNSGADFGARGYVSAYDAETGAMDWRFYTVPGNPANGFENPAMEMAAKTWGGEWWWLGGGGTVWDSIVYDPVTDLVLIGVVAGRRGRRICEVRVAAIICSCLLSWPSIRTTALTSGTTRRRRMKAGTTRPRSRS